MERSNGETPVTGEELSTRQLIEVLIEAVKQLSEQQDMIFEAQQETLESIRNLSLPGVDYSVED